MLKGILELWEVKKGIKIILYALISVRDFRVQHGKYCNGGRNIGVKELESFFIKKGTNCLNK
jgi:hypothetical protein